MRYPEEKIRAAILSPDAEARVIAVEYYTNSYSADPTIMPLVIEAVERFGRGDAGNLLIWAYRLVQTEATIGWAVRELDSCSAGKDQDYGHRLFDFLLQVDPRLVLPHEAELSAQLPLFRSRLARRLGLLEQSSDALWSDLALRCEEAVEDPSGGEGFDSRHADNVIDVLASRGGDAASFALATLARPLGAEDSGDWWLMPYAARLAGKLQLASAIPRLIEKLQLDSDYLDEQCERAFVRIGTPEAVEAIASAWPTATDAFQHYSAFALGNIRSDRAVEVLSELFASRPAQGLRAMLAEALIDQVTTEGIEAAVQLLSTGHVDFLLRSLRESALNAARFMGVSSPAIDALHQQLGREAAADEARRKELSKYAHGDLLFAAEKLSGRKTPQSELRRADARASSPSPHDPLVGPVERVVHAGPRVGRNDRCPCGSGKKYKLCCLRKQSG